MIASIEELFKGFSEMTGASPPACRPDAQGTRAATIRLREVVVSVRQLAGEGAECVLIAADMGEVPEDNASSVWRVLMEVNLYLSGEFAPTYSRHPVTGHAMLHWVLPLAEATVTDFYQRVMALVETVCQWRNDQFLVDFSAAYAWVGRGFAPAPFDRHQAEAAQAVFDELYNGILEELGEPVVEVVQRLPKGVVRFFPLVFDGLEIRVVQSLGEGRDVLYLLVPLELPEHDPSLEVMEALMDMNFEFAIDNSPTRVARPEGGEDFVLRYAYPLAGASPQNLLAHGKELARCAREWSAAMDAAHEQTSMAMA